jgi:hypothetical protein
MVIFTWGEIGVQALKVRRRHIALGSPGNRPL